MPMADAQPNDGLTPDLVLAIQRILEIQPSAEDDPLDTLSGDFDPVDALNQFFPDGSLRCRSHPLFASSHRYLWCYVLQDA